MANKIQFKRGTADPSASGNSIGEPLFRYDDTNSVYKLFVASSNSAVKWVGAPILDQNNMSSDSDVSLATQKSIKAFVEDSITAEYLQFTTDTVGNIQVDLDSETLSILGGEGMDVTHSGETITVAGEEASDSNKGIASFATADFTVTAGNVVIAADAVSNSQLANIAQGSVKVGGGSNAPTDLDAKTSGQILVGDGTDVASVAVSGDAAITSAGVVTVSGAANFDLDGNVDSSTQASTWTLIDNNAAALSFNATDKAGILKLVSTNSGEKVTMSGSCEIAGDITVTGDMTVSGDTTTTLAQTVVVEDPMVRLATGNTGDTYDIGLYGKYVATGDKYAGVFRDRSVTGDPWTFFDTLSTEPAAAGDVTVGSNNFEYAPIRCADITGSGATSGNGTLSGFDIDGGTWA